MTVRTQITDEMVVLKLNGNLMGGEEMEMLRKRLEDIKNAGLNRIVADLADVQLINSDGIGLLIQGLKSMREMDGDLKLANLSERVHNVLVDISCLNKVFDIHETTDQAIVSF